MTALIAAVIGVVARSAEADAVDCSWTSEEIEQVSARLGDWRAALTAAAGEALPASMTDRFEIFTDRTEADDATDGSQTARYTCIYRQVNVAGNALGMRFMLFDDTASLTKFIEWNTFVAMDEGAHKRNGIFDSPYESRIEDVDGVVGADLYCRVGRDGRCSQFDMLRQSESCTPMLIETFWGRDNDEDPNEATSVMLAATDDVLAYLTSPDVRAHCTASTSPPPCGHDRPQHSGPNRAHGIAGARAVGADAYDWRATEARFNACPQLLVEIDGLGIHWQRTYSRPHVRAAQPAASR